MADANNDDGSSDSEEVEKRASKDFSTPSRNSAKTSDQMENPQSREGSALEASGYNTSSKLNLNAQEGEYMTQGSVASAGNKNDLPEDKEIVDEEDA